MDRQPGDKGLTFLHPDQRDLGGENYVVGFEGEITVEAETQMKAENQGYDLLSHLGQVTVVAFKKEEEQVRLLPLLGE